MLFASIFLNDCTYTINFAKSLKLKILSENRQQPQSNWSRCKVGKLRSVAKVRKLKEVLLSTLEHFTDFPALEHFLIMNEFYPIPIQHVQANQSDVIRDLLRFVKNPIGARLALLTPPAAFTTARLTGNNLHWTLGDVTADTRLVLEATWPDSTKPARAVIKFKVSTEADTDILEWGWFPPIDVFVDDSGNFSGTIAPGIDENLNNPSGATVTYTIPSKSASIASASLNTDNDLSISVTGLTRNIFNAFVTVRASATIDGEPRTTERQINVWLIYSSRDVSVGKTGKTGENGRRLNGCRTHRKNRGRENGENRGRLNSRRTHRKNRGRENGENRGRLNSHRTRRKNGENGRRFSCRRTHRKNGCRQNWENRSGLNCRRKNGENRSGLDSRRKNGENGGGLNCRRTRRQNWENRSRFSSRRTHRENGGRQNWENWSRFNRRRKNGENRGGLDSRRENGENRGGLNRRRTRRQNWENGFRFNSCRPHRKNGGRQNWENWSRLNRCRTRR